MLLPLRALQTSHVSYLFGDEGGIGDDHVKGASNVLGDVLWSREVVQDEARILRPLRVHLR